jgi:hypothetical protein
MLRPIKQRMCLAKKTCIDTNHVSKYIPMIYTYPN